MPVDHERLPLRREKVFDCKDHARRLQRVIRYGKRRFNGERYRAAEWVVFIDGITPHAIPRRSLVLMRRYQCLRRFAGVYTVAATVGQIADDLRATLGVMPVAGVQVI